jgi:hypothetical protein
MRKTAFQELLAMTTTKKKEKNVLKASVLSGYSRSSALFPNSLSFGHIFL